MMLINYITAILNICTIEEVTIVQYKDKPNYGWGNTKKIEVTITIDRSYQNKVSNLNLVNLENCAIVINQNSIDFIFTLDYSYDALCYICDLCILKNIKNLTIDGKKETKRYLAKL